eukprot:9899868-Heterocapsa_arctica.AAC.1
MADHPTPPLSGAERAKKAAAMAGIVGSLAPRLRAAFWNDWNKWLLAPVVRQTWVLVHDRPTWRNPLEATAAPWAYRRA